MPWTDRRHAPIYVHVVCGAWCTIATMRMAYFFYYALRAYKNVLRIKLYLLVIFSVLHGTLSAAPRPPRVFRPSLQLIQRHTINSSTWALQIINDICSCARYQVVLYTQLKKKKHVSCGTGCLKLIVVHIHTRVLRIVFMVFCCWTFVITLRRYYRP